MNGYKDIENRSWRTTHRGPLLIHASSTRDKQLLADAPKVLADLGISLPPEFEFGGIVGVVDVTDCVKRSDSPWYFPGNWGWVLENPRRLPFRECKGFVGLFYPKLQGR